MMTIVGLPAEEQFLRVFAQYNQAVWPLQPALYAIAALALFYAVRKHPQSDKVVTAGLAFLWLWMGVVYHLAFFTSINKAAFVFGAAFVLQALLFFSEGIRKSALTFRFRRNIYGLSGLIFFIYALIAYPLLGSLLGRTYPAAPTFGLPCPTTIFTFGLLLWLDCRTPLRLLLIPLAWSVVGSTAAVFWGVTEDVGLLASGVIAATLIFTLNRKFRAGKSSLMQAG